MSTDADTAARRFFFLHIMKTAGTSFAVQLRVQFPGAAMYPTRGVDWTDPSDVEPYQSIPQLLALPPERRAEIRAYTGHFPYFVRDLIDPSLTTITLLREPVERTVSVLKHFKRLDRRLHALTLEEIYDDDQTFRYFVANHQAKVFCLTPEDGARTILRPIVVDDDRFRLATRNLAEVEVVGRMERYGEFLEELRSRFGWWPQGTVAEARSNVSGEAWDVDAALRRRIADENPYDLAFYQYACELIERRRLESSGAPNVS